MFGWWGASGDVLSEQAGQTWCCRAHRAHRAPGAAVVQAVPVGSEGAWRNNHLGRGASGLHRARLGFSQVLWHVINRKSLE